MHSNKVPVDFILSHLDLSVEDIVVKTQGTLDLLNVILEPLDWQESLSDHLSHKVGAAL